MEFSIMATCAYCIYFSPFGVNPVHRYFVENIHE